MNFLSNIILLIFMVFGWISCLSTVQHNVRIARIALWDTFVGGIKWVCSSYPCLCLLSFLQYGIANLNLLTFKFIATPIKDYGNSEPGKRSMIFLKHKILKSILLRRTKKGRAADLALPPRIVISSSMDTLVTVNDNGLNLWLFIVFFPPLL